MAPEVLMGDKHGCAVDVYSFAITAYEILTTEEPYGKINIRDLNHLISSNQRPKFNSDFTEPMKKLISQCWSQIPSDRPSFDEIYKELSTNYKLYADDLLDEDEFLNYIDILGEYSNSKISSEKVLSKSSEKAPTKEENYYFGNDEEDNFQTVAKIGEGMTSTVFKLIDKRTLNPLCKKILKVEGTSFKDLQNAVKEFQVLHSLEHPSICKAMGINTSEVIESDTSAEEEVTSVALFLEFIDFKLQDCLKNGMISSTLKARIIVEICHRMRYIHSKGLIYRDLKIDNIMLNSIFQAKLIDFGLVHVNEILFGEDLMNTISMTKNIGLERFMSPEMMKEEDYDYKTDVYSFGIVLYFIFFEKLPTQSMKDKANGKPVKLPVQSELITKDCIDLIAKCLDYNPKSRPSFDEILKYLKEHNYMLANDVDPTIVSQRDNELESIESQ